LGIFVVVQTFSKLRAVVLTTALVLLSGGVAVGSGTQPPLYTVSTGSADANQQGYAGQGITVAVIDTGVADVPAMSGTVIHQENMSAGPRWGDQYGHGTFVAGLVHRVAPQAKIVSVKLSGANGAVDVTQVMAALQWVALNRDRFSIDVVNLSFGNDSKQSWKTSPLNYAVQQVWDEGIPVVVSAGNLGELGSNTVTKPADDPLVISVGASDEVGTAPIGDDVIPGFVSRGPTQDGLTKPDLVAPGASVVSVRAPGSTIDNQFPQARVGEDGFRGSGTSFAAPIVTGLVAQLLSADPTLTPDEIKYALLASAQPVSGEAFAQGSGTVSVLSALQHLHKGRANQNVVERSTASGSLNGARGSALIDVPDQELLESLTAEERDALADSLGEDNRLLGNGTGQLRLFNREEFRNDAAWSASRWGASRWGSTQWGASRWGASRWGASRWGANHWWASRWG
jgi:serine protease AprX